MEPIEISKSRLTVIGTYVWSEDQSGKETLVTIYDVEDLQILGENLGDGHVNFQLHIKEHPQVPDIRPNKYGKR